MEPKYTIERHEHGWLVRGPVPADDLIWMVTTMVPRNARADALIAEATGATIALATPEGITAWRKQLGIQP